MWTPPEHHHAVTEAGKVYWSVRNALGEFCRIDGTNRSTRAWTLSEWHAYLTARYACAERVTRGHMVNALGLARGVKASTLLRPNAPLHYASDELRDWFQEHRPTLSWSSFTAAITERSGE